MWHELGKVIHTFKLHILAEDLASLHPAGMQPLSRS
jgi:hypothetical protein